MQGRKPRRFDVEWHAELFCSGQRKETVHEENDDGVGKEEA